MPSLRIPTPRIPTQRIMTQRIPTPILPVIFGDTTPVLGTPISPQFSPPNFRYNKNATPVPIPSGIRAELNKLSGNISSQKMNSALQQSNTSDFKQMQAPFKVVNVSNCQKTPKNTLKHSNSITEMARNNSSSTRRRTNKPLMSSFQTLPNLESLDFENLRLQSHGETHSQFTTHTTATSDQFLTMYKNNSSTLNDLQNSYTKKSQNDSYTKKSQNDSYAKNSQHNPHFSQNIDTQSSQFQSQNQFNTTSEYMGTFPFTTAPTSLQALRQRPIPIPINQQLPITPTSISGNKKIHHQQPIFSQLLLDKNRKSDEQRQRLEAEQSKSEQQRLKHEEYIRKRERNKSERQSNLEQHKLIQQELQEKLDRRAKRKADLRAKRNSEKLKVKAENIKNKKNLTEAPQKSLIIPTKHSFERTNSFQQKPLENRPKSTLPSSNKPTLARATSSLAFNTTPKTPRPISAIPNLAIYTRSGSASTGLTQNTPKSSVTGPSRDSNYISMQSGSNNNLSNTSAIGKPVLTCNTCSNPIFDKKFITALGADFHSDCFKCCNCNAKLTTFLNLNGESCCPSCFDGAAKAQFCGKCERQLKSKIT